MCINITVLIETVESYLRIEYWPYLILTKPACMVMGATFLNYSQALSLINVGVGFSNTPPHAQHYWAWCVDINGGWPDSGNLIAGASTDLGEALIPF
jgi:hypothetical protein